MSIERADPRHKGFSNNSICKKKLIERYSFCNEYITNKTVLDIPCGLGWGTSMLKGHKDIYAIDISKEAISFAINNYPNINFICGSMIDIPFSNSSFDVIICLEGYEHISSSIQYKFIKEVKRVLDREGLFIVSIPLAKPNGNMSGNPYHLHEPTPDEINNVLDANFDKIFYHIDVDINIDILKYVGTIK